MIYLRKNSIVNDCHIKVLEECFVHTCVILVSRYIICVDFLFFSEYLASCLEIKQQSPSAESGTYRIETGTTNTVLDVFCDMDTDGGGWTLVWSFR